ncbi:MAG: LytTR family DNA-binding domain-containing protein [Bacteroidota bacterium]
MINCLILEDEKAAQEMLKNYASKIPQLKILAIFESGIDVPIHLLEQADLLFLDIQLPELTGIQYLKSLANPPKVIITTAYPDYAIEAFEVAVVDYLLKPFSFDRFLKAFNRIQTLTATNKEQANTFFVYADKTTYKIHSNDILFLKAEIDYVKIQLTDQAILVLGSLRNWKEKLSKLHFQQIHRSYIVNMEKVRKIAGNQLFLTDHQYLPIGPTYKATVMDRFTNQP